MKVLARLGSSAVLVESVGDQAESLLSFAGLGEPAEGTPQIRLEDGFVVRSPRVVHRLSDKASALTVLLDELSHDLVVDAADGLAVHAALVAWEGRALLLPGISGSGKSTTALRLATSGWQLHGDESAWIPTSGPVSGARRPVCLKPGSTGVVRRLLDSGRLHDDDVLRGPHRILVRFAGHPDPAELAGIVFPSFGAPLAVARLTRSETTRRLMECVVNARNLPSNGFAAGLALARRLPGYSLQTDGVETDQALSRRLRALAQSAGVSAAP